MGTLMVWAKFLLSAAVISVAALYLAKYADVIAVRTGLGGMFVGTLLLAGATSLSELFTMIESVRAGYPEIAAGNLLGANMMNMLLLAVLDLVHNKRRILRKSAMKHAVSGALTVLMITLGVFFILIDMKQGIRIGNLTMGIDSLILVAVFFFSMVLLRSQNNPKRHKNSPIVIPPDCPPLWQGLLGFSIAAAILSFSTQFLVSSSAEIAEISGLGRSVIGSTLVAFVTCIPELVSTISAAKFGADDMAIGNLFGSSLFNIFVLGLADLFYAGGLFIGAIDPSFLIIGMLGLIMTIFGLLGNLVLLEKRLWFIELDALVIILMYIAGVALLVQRGLAV